MEKINKLTHPWKAMKLKSNNLSWTKKIATILSKQEKPSDRKIEMELADYLGAFTGSLIALMLRQTWQTKLD